jgi:hypothetical protein
MKAKRGAFPVGRPVFIYAKNMVASLSSEAYFPIIAGIKESKLLKQCRIRLV